MNKRKLFFAMCCLTAVLAIGCGKKNSTDTKNPEQVEKQDNTKTDNADKNDTKNDNEKDNNDKTASETTKGMMQIYFINMDSGEIQTEKVETEDLSAEKTWSLLQEYGVLTQECRMNSFKVNEEEKTIDLDVDEGFGNYIRSMGTTGETEVLACVVNTYLDSFQCERIKITEAGHTFETSGAVLAGYMTKQQEAGMRKSEKIIKKMYGIIVDSGNVYYSATGDGMG